MPSIHTAVLNFHRDISDVSATVPEVRHNVLNIRNEVSEVKNEPVDPYTTASGIRGNSPNNREGASDHNRKVSIRNLPIIDWPLITA